MSHFQTFVNFFFLNSHYGMVGGQLGVNLPSVWVSCHLGGAGFARTEGLNIQYRLGVGIGPGGTSATGAGRKGPGSWDSRHCTFCFLRRCLRPRR